MILRQLVPSSPSDLKPNNNHHKPGGLQKPPVCIGVVMLLQDFHIHSTYCDGKSTLEETVKTAISRGIKRIGFSGHSYTPFDSGYCMSPADTDAYINEIKALKERYASDIDVLCGIELDVFSDIDLSPFDYVIGSAHYIKRNGEYIPVDLSADTLYKAVEKHFNFDVYELTKAYYDTVALLADKKIDIIGHFDLITKFNRGHAMFDETDPRYTTAAINALEKLIPLNVPFEINTGVIIRGYKDAPYPAEHLLDEINARGGRFLLNSDSHRSDMLCFEFEKWHAWAENRNVKWYK